jgi:hypothetical protein
MAANKLTKQQRQELGRRLAQWNKERLEAGALPADFFRQAGRKGFRVCLQKHGCEKVAQLLSRFYGREITPGALEHHLARAREHAQTRAAYPLEGQVCFRCGQPAQEHHHLDGWEAGHAPDQVWLLCRACHRALEIARARAS